MRIVSSLPWKFFIYLFVVVFSRLLTFFWVGGVSKKSVRGRAPETGTRGTRWVRTEHIWSDKRKFQLMADWTQRTSDWKNSQQIGQTDQQTGQTVLKIGQNISQWISLSTLMGNLFNLHNLQFFCRIMNKFSNIRGIACWKNSGFKQFYFSGALVGGPFFLAD